MYCLLNNQTENLKSCWMQCVVSDYPGYTLQDMQGHIFLGFLVSRRSWNFFLSQVSQGHWGREKGTVPRNKNVEVRSQSGIVWYVCVKREANLDSLRIYSPKAAVIIFLDKGDIIHRKSFNTAPACVIWCSCDNKIEIIALL